jgi:hypothetical protein
VVIVYLGQEPVYAATPTSNFRNPVDDFYHF